MKLAQLVAFVPRLPLFNNSSLVLVQTGVQMTDDGTGNGIYNGMPFSGAVDPSQSETLIRMLDGQSLNGAIIVRTSTPLSAGHDGRAPDVIGWNNRRYQVRAVSDYAEGGTGLRVAACTLIDINPQL